jgi:hypothetical protein
VIIVCDRLRRSTSALALLLLLGGCDPGWKIEGTVIDSSGAPIAGATVVLTFPGPPGSGPASETVVTDPAGRFQFGGVSGASTSSKGSLAISKTGFTTKTITATDACHRSTPAHNFGTPCAPTDGRVTLTP